MQLFTDSKSLKPVIQIRVAGSGQVQLLNGELCVETADSYQAASRRAAELEALLSAPHNFAGRITVDVIAEPEFSSPFGCWVVEMISELAGGAAALISAFEAERDATTFARWVNDYNAVMPACTTDGEWTAKQIAWFKAHPAPLAAAYGGVARSRYLPPAKGVH